MVSTWSPGAKGQCQRCGFKYLLTELRKESTGARVCGPCWDPRPQDLYPPRMKPEGLPKPGASPEPEPRYIIRANLVTADNAVITADSGDNMHISLDAL